MHNRSERVDERLLYSSKVKMSSYYRAQRRDPTSLPAPSAPPTPSEGISAPQRTEQYRAVPQNPPAGSKNIQLASPKPVQYTPPRNKNLVLPSPKQMSYNPSPNRNLVLPEPKQLYYQHPPPHVIYVERKHPHHNHRPQNWSCIGIFVVCVIISIVVSLLLYNYAR
jgi:hypothetical protein